MTVWGLVQYSAPGKSTIIDWYAKFKRGPTNTDDAERSGHPKSAVVPQNITKVHKIVLGDRKFKLRKIANTLRGEPGLERRKFHFLDKICEIQKKRLYGKLIA